MDITKILVVRFSSIGDIVLTTPVVRRLKQQLEGPVEIHYLTKKSFAPLLLSNPHIDQVHTIEKATAEVDEVLKNEGFAYIIDLHRNIRSAMVKRTLKSLSFTLSKYNWEKWLLVNFGIDKMPDKHIVDRYLDTIKAFGTKDDGLGLDLNIPSEDRVDIADFGVEFSNGYVAIAIGGAHIGKRMPTDRWPDIIKGISLPVVLLGDENDSTEAEKIAKGLPGKVFNACGSFNILQSASIVDQSRCLVSGDTGLMHIGAALGKDIVSLWGCTVPEFGMSPYRPGEKSIILEPENLKKRPCSKLGNRCKYGEENRCITHIDNETIINAVNGIVG